MNTLDVSGLSPSIGSKIIPMLENLLSAHRPNIHSLHIVGSAVMADYSEKMSDINSVVVLHRMDFKFIAFLAPLGNKFGRHGVAAPLVMTPDYIRKSLDAFPIEFLDFKLIHTTVFGTDILQDLAITKPNLRLQCEREIKTKLIHARQGFISSLGKKDRLLDALVQSFTGSMALFRAIIYLLGSDPPIPRSRVISSLGAASGIDSGIFERLLMLKTGRVKPSEQELVALFETYHAALEAAEKIIDELPL